MQQVPSLLTSILIHCQPGTIQLYRRLLLVTRPDAPTDYPSVLPDDNGGNPHTATTQDVFKFTLTRNDPSYPMPNNATTDSVETSVDVSGDNNFGELVFSQPGTYVYTIKEVTGTNQRVTYDKSVYTLTYTVFKNDDGELDSPTTLLRPLKMEP